MENKIEPSNSENELNINEVKDNNKMNKNKQIYLHWENINVYSSHSKFNIRDKICCKKQTEPPKHILKNVNGIAKPGSLMAFMGASGAGKTTLLNVLNFRNRGNLKIMGDVKINGSIITSGAELSSISGYVQQEDLFIGFLKVKEQLKFQAQLKMDRLATKTERDKRVEEVMNDLNLKKCENTFIGSPEGGVKGISGGERRRLAFACELITNPNLMFLDEPTSGLDSFMAMSIVESMRNLANKGKTIICTIHQPSSETFDKFDRLCLLAEGQLAFLGDLNEAPKYFASQELMIPLNYNPADFYINVLAISPTDREGSKLKVEKICENFKTSLLNENLNNEIAYANKLASTSSDNQVILSKKASYKANFLTQFKWLLWRAFISSIRDPFTTQVSILQTIIIALLIGLIFFRLQLDQAGVQNINGVLFIIMINNSFSYLFSVINAFTSEIPIFLRENQDGMYMVASYYLAKIFIDLPKFIILPFVFVTINYWMSNLNNDPARYFICCLMIILVANTAASFGSFLSAAAPNANGALSMAGPVLVPLMIFSGFFLNNSSVPVYFIWLKYLSWFNYANELLLINQWDGVKNISCSVESTKCFKNGADVLTALNMNTSNYAIDFIALLILLVGWRAITYGVLLFKSYRK